MWIVAYTPQIAFEVRVIHGIEAQQRREQAPVGGGDARAQQVTPLRQTDVHLVERGEQGIEGLFVGLLRRREASAVHAYVDAFVNFGVERIHLRTQRGRKKQQARVAEGVEGAVEHLDDLGGFVVDDGARVLVEQHRNGDAAGVV